MSYNKSYRCLLMLLLFLTDSLSLFAQTQYPIIVQPQLTPPYSLTLSDYSNIGSQRLVVNIHVKDVSVLNLPVRLHIKMETMTGVSIENIPNFYTVPINLGGGELRMLYGEDLKDYFNIDNLVFKGYSKNQYRNTGQLPEGFYRFTVEVRHYTTGRLISNRGMTTAWFALGKPPVLKQPADKSEEGKIMGMPITFSWIPNNIGIPNAGVQYKFELWEMRIDGIDPYVIANSMPTKYETTQFMTDLVVHPSQLDLEPGMKYAWRVTAFDPFGNIPFDQKGRSQIRTFTYQCKCDPATNLIAERRGQDMIWRWTPENNHTSFNVEVEDRENHLHDLFDNPDSQVKFPDVDYGTTYHLRVQAICNGNQQNPSPFTEWKSLTIPEKVEWSNPDCGQEVVRIPITNYTLRDDLKEGDFLTHPKTGNSRYTIKTAIPQGDGKFKGQFWSWWGWAGPNVKVLCDYRDLSVNTDNQIITMKYESVYNPQFLLDVDKIKDAIDKVTDIIKPPKGDEKKPNNTDTIVPIIIPGKDKIKLDTIQQPPVIVIYGENNEEIIIPTNGDGTTTITDADGNKFVVDKDGNVTQTENDNTQESKTKIEEGDTSLYVAIEEMDVVDGQKSKVNRNYEHNETIILPAGKYKFKAVREYVAVRESEKEDNLDSLQANVITVKELSNKHESFKTTPYFWHITTNDYEGKNEVEYSFSNKGSYTIAVEARTYTLHLEGDKETYIQSIGVPDTFKLHILVLDPEPVYFSKGDNYKGEYGFDSYEKTELRGEYETLDIKKTSGEIIDYAIPYMSVKSGQSCNIFASVNVTKDYLKGLDKNAAAYTFSSDDGITINGSNTYTLTKNNLKEGPNKISLNIVCNSVSNYDSPKLITVTDLKSKEVGRIKVYCSAVDKQETVNLVKVYLGDNRELNNLKTPEQLRSEMLNFLKNNSYNQLFAEFTQGDVGELSISDNELKEFINKEMPAIDGLEQLFNEDREIKIQDKDRNPATAIIQTKMERDRRFDSWTGKTIIVIANRNKEKDGSSRTNAYSIITDATANTGEEIIMYYSGSIDYTTYTHELGHLLGLKHPFPDDDPKEDIGKPKDLIDKGTSRNFMDYSPATDMFWKWQWEILRENIGKIVDKQKE